MDVSAARSSIEWKQRLKAKSNPVISSRVLGADYSAGAADERTMAFDR